MMLTLVTSQPPGLVVVHEYTAELPAGKAKDLVAEKGHRFSAVPDSTCGG